MIDPPKMPPIPYPNISGDNTGTIVNALNSKLGELKQEKAELLGEKREQLEAGAKGALEQADKAGKSALQQAQNIAQAALSATSTPINGNVASLIADGGLDLLNPARMSSLLDFGRSQLPGSGDIAPGNNDYAGFYNEISSLGNDIKSLQDQLTSGKNPDGSDMTSDQKTTLQLDLQQAMQERLQLITLLSNLIKKEHDSATAVINNIRG